MPVWDLSTSAKHHFGRHLGRLWGRMADMSGVGTSSRGEGDDHIGIHPGGILRPPDQFGGQLEESEYIKLH